MFLSGEAVGDSKAPFFLVGDHDQQETTKQHGCIALNLFGATGKISWGNVMTSKT